MICVRFLILKCQHFEVIIVSNDHFYNHELMINYYVMQLLFFFPSFVMFFFSLFMCLSFCMQNVLACQYWLILLTSNLFK